MLSFIKLEGLTMSFDNQPENAIRKKYLMALAQTFGADMFLAEMSIDALIENKDNIRLDHLKGLGELPKSGVRQIKAIARWMLADSPILTGWEFAAGQAIIGLLKENPRVELFSRLYVLVNLWTKKGDEFQKMVGNDQ